MQSQAAGWRWGGLAAWVAVTFAAAAIGNWATGSSVGDWYGTLRKPSWTPPGWLFGPVWTVLYASMATAAWMVWRRVGWGRATAAYGVQLALNAGWSVLFFGLRQPGWAAAEIIALWLAIAVTIALFARESKAAAWLLVPYLAWVTFAAALNVAIWRLN